MAESLVDPDIWHRIAGATVRLPTVGSIAYYFPLRHPANDSSYPNILPPHLLNPVKHGKPIFCSVNSVKLLADPITDEVFAKLTLLRSTEIPIPPSSAAPIEPITDEIFGSDEDSPIESFTKVLTSDDVNNGVFSVPSACASIIFPARVTKDTEKPWQVLDVHGKTWKFGHRKDKWCNHTLTTGWSRFVESKKLVEGNTLVFMKKLMRVFIGIRRSGPSRESKGKSSPEEIMKGLELAAQLKPFEVLFYPRVWMPDFVVRDKFALLSRLMNWKPRMRVQMEVENVGVFKWNWVHGTISELENISSFPLLKIEWDEELHMEPSWVNPWWLLPRDPPSHVHGTEDADHSHSHVHGTEDTDLDD